MTRPKSILRLKFVQRLFAEHLRLPSRRLIAIPRMNVACAPFHLQLARELRQNEHILGDETTWPEGERLRHQAPQTPLHKAHAQVPQTSETGGPSPDRRKNVDRVTAVSVELGMALVPDDILDPSHREPLHAARGEVPPLHVAVSWRAAGLDVFQEGLLTANQSVVPV